MFGPTAAKPIHPGIILEIVSNLLPGVSSAHAWETGGNKDPILVLSSWALMNSQDRAVLELMGHL